MAFDTPILFLIFNRPDTTERVFGEIRKLRPSQLFIAADGPRADHPLDAELCERCKKITSAIDWDCELRTLYRKENLGCGVAPAGAITWFFDQVEKGIILEDDILPDPSFFVYCEQMLERFKDEQKIMHISGCYFLESFDISSAQSYYFTKHIHVWGWATWRRAWKSYDFEMKDFSENAFRKRMAGYYGPYSIFWNGIFSGMKKTRRDIWDYQWMFAIFKNNGIAINPTENLTLNIGFNSQATHTRDPESVFTKVRLSSLKAITAHQNTVIDEERDHLYYKYYLDFDLEKVRKQRNTIWKLKNLLRKLKEKF